MKDIKWLKRALALGMSALLAFAAAGCGADDKTEAENPSASAEASAETASAEPEKAEWQQFVEEYEAVVDRYIELLGQYKENPSDTSLLSEFNDMTEQLTEMSERAQTISADLSTNDTEALETFASEITRVAEKMQDAANSLQQ